MTHATRIDWGARLRATARQLAEDPSYAGAHRAFLVGEDAPEAVEGFVTSRVAILRNVTVEPWLPELYVALLQRGVKATFAVGDYSVYERYAAAPSEIAGPDTDHVLVYLDPGALVGDARHDPPDDLEDTLVERIDGIVGGLLGRSAATVVVSNLAPDAHGIHALHADQDPRGWQHRRRAVNAAMVERFAGEPRVAILDVDRVVGDYGGARAFDTRMYLTAGTPFAVDFLPSLARAFADIVAAGLVAPRKCVVVDCDNTLWGGILGEDGPEGVAIGRDYPGSAYREFQLFLAGLRRRGFILAISSKNAEADVLSFISESPEMVLRPNDFAAHRINWRDKAASLVELAEEINIGLDAMIFVDDSPFECERVRTALPEVQVERFPANPVEIPAFQAALEGVGRLRVGWDDLARNESIRANARRERLKREAPDPESFLRSLDIALVVDRQPREAVQRVSQLARRTNQFNLTTKRHGVGDVERLMESGVVYAMRMRDRFSDYGIVGAAIALADGGGAWEIDSFMLSCRAFGRGVESVLLAALIEDARGAGAATVRARFVATRKNGMTRDFFPEHGFAVTRESEDERWFEVGLRGWKSAIPDGRYDVRLKGFAE